LYRASSPQRVQRDFDQRVNPFGTVGVHHLRPAQPADFPNEPRQVFGAVVEQVGWIGTARQQNVRLDRQVGMGLSGLRKDHIGDNFCGLICHVAGCLTPRRTSISRTLVGMLLSIVEQLLRFVNLIDVLTRPFPEGKHRLA
jgi:hypothetical protein